MTFAEAVPHCIALGKKIKCSLWIDGVSEFNHYVMWDNERFSFAKHFVWNTPAARTYWVGSEEGHPMTYWFPSKEEVSADWEIIE